MNAFDTLCDTATAHASAVAGRTFKLDGATTLYTGVVDAHRKRTKLAAGGFELQIDATLMAHASQFDGLTLPRTGTRLYCDGHTYTIAELHRDGSGWVFLLQGVNQ